MPVYNKPVTEASIINDLSRRLYKLESAARVLPTNAVIPELVPSNYAGVSVLDATVRPSAYDGSDHGDGLHFVSGVPMQLPEVTVTGALFTITATWQWLGWRGAAGTGAYYADRLAMYIYIDGSAAYGGAAPVTTVDMGNDVGFYKRAEMTVTADLAQGDHTFECRWLAAPSAAPVPTSHSLLSYPSLIVTPLRLS